MERQIHTAQGVRDAYRSELIRKLEIMRAVHAVFEEYGYEDIETPTFEYFEVFGSEIGTTPSRELFKFFDREGDTLVLRPDFTPGVARAASMHFADAPRPLRLCYSGNTFVNTPEHRGMLKEITQMGVERIGEDSAEADRAVLSLMIRSMLAAGCTEIEVSIGEVNFFKSLAAAAKISEEETEHIRSLIQRKNYYAVEDLLRASSLDQTLIHAFVRLPQLFGGLEVLREAEELAVDERSASAARRLLDIYELLSAEGLEKYISFDLGALSKYHYYTGIIFSAFTYGSGEPIAKGGRYDDLLAHFGMPDPAVGAALTIRNLMPRIF